MSKVGNDVVDLDDPAIADSHLRPRFLARVCAPSERAMIAAAVEPKVLLWSLFAAKEAAFKVVVKLGPRPVFAHRAFVVSPDLRSVRYGERVVPVWIDVQGACVHAVASTGATAPLSGVATLPDGADPGVEARRLLLSKIGGGEVVRDPAPGSWDGYGPPRLVRDGVTVDRDISLSHDGRFVAFAAAA